MFSISYAIVTEESAEHGEAEEIGMEHEGLTLREAYDLLRWHGHAMQADCWPISKHNPPRWLSWEAEQDYQTGAYTERDLHLPQNLTASSRVRIARLFGLKTEQGA